jgi:hypothetical protein
MMSRAHPRNAASPLVFPGNTSVPLVIAARRQAQDSPARGRARTTLVIPARRQAHDSPARGRARTTLVIPARRQAQDSPARGRAGTPLVIPALRRAQDSPARGRARTPLVIPAKAGIHVDLVSAVGCNNSNSNSNSNSTTSKPVLASPGSAQAAFLCLSKDNRTATQSLRIALSMKASKARSKWIPAFAGMTNSGAHRRCGRPSIARRSVSTNIAATQLRSMLVSPKSATDRQVCWLPIRVKVSGAHP